MKQFLILSYPRSGNTLMRLILEEAFNCRTYGYVSKIDIAPLKYTESGYKDYDPHLVGIKQHYSSKGFICPLIYIERDIVEATQSHKDKGSTNSIEQERKYWIDTKIESFLYGHSKVHVDFNKLISGDLSFLKEFGSMIGVEPKEIDFNSVATRAREIYKLQRIEDGN